MGESHCVSVRTRPTPPLRPFVSEYVDFDMAGWPPGRHRGLPGAGLTLVVSFGTPPTICRSGRRDVTAVACLGGLASEAVDVLHDGTQRGVQLALSPRGARALLGVPAAALVDETVSLDDVVGTRADELVERVAAAAGPAERAVVLDRVLTGWWREHEYPDVVDAAWTQLAASGGSVSIDDLAAGLGVGRRHLSQRVRAELGVTPKAAARVFRFSRSRASLLSSATVSLAATAATCGYFDQAHMSNEWRRLAGCTLGEWIREELPFLQDNAAGADA
jgi:AraC-like DNA-binding protein